MERGIVAPSALMPIRQTGSLPPLFCVHGQPLKLAQRLRADRPVYAINYVYQTDDLRGMPDSIEGLAQQYVAEIQRVQPKGPYYLFGFSVGSVIAYEMGRILENSGQELAHVMLVEPIFEPGSGPRRIKQIAKGARAHGVNRKHLTALWDVILRMIKRRPLALSIRIRTIWYRTTGFSMPERLRLINYLAYLKPLVRRYECRPLRAQLVDIVYKQVDDEYFGFMRDFWEQLGVNARLHRMGEAHAHLDLMEDPALTEIANILDRNIKLQS